MPPVHGLFDRARACSSTSDALSDDTRRDLPFGRSRPRREVSPRPPSRQRRPPPPDQSAFPRQVPSRSSIVSPPLAQSTADFTRSSKTRHRLPSLAAEDRLRTSFSLRSPRDDTSRGRAPLGSRSYLGICRARRLLSTSAIQTAYEHHHEPSEPWSRLSTRHARLAPSGEETSERGWGPAASSIADSRCRLARIDEGLAARAHPRARRQPGFHERGGRPTSGATTVPRAPCAVLAYARSKDIDPGPIRPSTSCRGSAPISVGSRHRRSITCRSRCSIQASRLTVGTLHVSTARSPRPPYDALARAARHA